MKQKITPEVINARDLKKHDVFVFGSNLAGVHGAGAARFAYDLGLAVAGRGIGLYLRHREQIGSYAIPTKGMRIEVLPLSWIEYFVKDFISEVENDQEGLNFLVTPVGCGLAGFKVAEIAPLFKPLVGKSNVSLPEPFLNFYEGKPVIINGKEEKYELGREQDGLTVYSGL